MNNEQQKPDVSAEAQAKTPVFRTRPFIIAAAVLLALAILADAALVTVLCLRGRDKGAGEGDGGDASSLTAFDYAAVDIAQYIPGFSLSMITNLKVPGREHKVEKATDDEDVKDYINRLLLTATDAEGNYLYRTVSDEGKLNRTKAIDYADSVYLYILYVEENGERIAVDYFNNAYSDSELIVGLGTLGKDLDEKLIGLKPIDCGTVETITVGTVKAGDIAIVTYTATIDGEDRAYESYTGERWDLSAIDADLSQAVLTNCKAIGQPFTFDRNFDIDDDGESELVHYEATVGAVALEENVCKISAKLPEDYFGTSMDEKYTNLNGKTLDFYLIIDYSIAYEISYEKSVKTTDENGKTVTVTETVFVETFDALTAEYIKGTLEYDHGVSGSDAAADAAAREKYLAYQKEQLVQNYDSTVKQTAGALIWQYLLETLNFASLPEEEKATLAATQMQKFVSEYDNYAAQYYDFIEYFPTYEAYLKDMYGDAYDEETYKTYDAFFNEYMAPMVLKEKLLTYYIYEKLGVKNDTEKYNSLREKNLNDVIELAAYYGHTYTQEDALKYLGGETSLHDLVVGEMVQDYLIANNEVDWELSVEK